MNWTLILALLATALSAVAAWLELPAADAYVGFAAAIISAGVALSSWQDLRRSQKELAAALKDAEQKSEHRAIEAEMNAVDMNDRYKNSFGS